VSSKKFHASFTTTSIPIPQGLAGCALVAAFAVDSLGAMDQIFRKAARSMQHTSADGKERCRAVLISLGIYTVFGPLILVALIRGAGLDGDVAMLLLVVGYAVTFLILLFAGFSQFSAVPRKPAYSSLVFAGAALLWILVLLLLLPSLART
jgi:hypothetical protein